MSCFTHHKGPHILTSMFSNQMPNKSPFCVVINWTGWYWNQVPTLKVEYRYVKKWTYHESWIRLYTGGTLTASKYSDRQTWHHICQHGCQNELFQDVNEQYIKERLWVLTVSTTSYFQPFLLAIFKNIFMGKFAWLPREQQDILNTVSKWVQLQSKLFDRDMVMWSYT